MKNLKSLFWVLALLKLSITFGMNEKKAIEPDRLGLELINAIRDLQFNKSSSDYSKLDHELKINCMIQSKDINLNVKTEAGFTALMYAIMLSNENISKMLINAGVDTDIKSNAGETALMIACLFGHTGIVKFLIEAKTNLNAQENNKKRTALMIVIKKYSESDIKDLFKFRKIIKLLIENNADFSRLKDIEGKTALDYSDGLKSNFILELIKSRATKQIL